MAENVDSVECSICLKDSTCPKVIDCKHVFCEQCLTDLINTSPESHQLSCLNCRQLTQVPENGSTGFQSYVAPHVETINSAVCGVCETGNDSQFKCEDCGKCLCSDCKITHDKFSTTHNIFLLDGNSMNAERKMFCLKHKGDKFEFYCVDCSEMICIKCLMSSHKEHATPDIRDYEPEAKLELENLKKMFEVRRDEFQRHVDAVNVKKQHMNETMTTANSSIVEQIKEIQQAMTTIGDRMGREMKTTCGEEEEKMNEIIEDMNKLIVRVETSLTAMSEALDSGSVYGIIDILPNLRSQSVDLKSIITTQITDVKSEFHQGKINTDSLKVQIGELQISRGSTFSHTFIKGTLNEEDRNRWLYSRKFIFKGLHWHIMLRIPSQHSNYFDVGLSAYSGVQTDIQSFTATVTFKVINNNNNNDVYNRDTQTVTKDFKSVYDSVKWKNALQPETSSIFGSHDLQPETSSIFVSHGLKPAYITTLQPKSSPGFSLATKPQRVKKTAIKHKSNPGVQFGTPYTIKDQINFTVEATVAITNINM